MTAKNIAVLTSNIVLTDQIILKITLYTFF